MVAIVLVAVAVSVAVGKVVGGSDGREKIVYSGVKTLIHVNIGIC